MAYNVTAVIPASDGAGTPVPIAANVLAAIEARVNATLTGGANTMLGSQGSESFITTSAGSGSGATLIPATGQSPVQWKIEIITAQTYNDARLSPFAAGTNIAADTDAGTDCFIAKAQAYSTTATGGIQDNLQCVIEVSPNVTVPLQSLLFHRNTSSEDDDTSRNEEA